MRSPAEASPPFPQIALPAKFRRSPLSPLGSYVIVTETRRRRALWTHFRACLPAPFWIRAAKNAATWYSHYEDVAAGRSWRCMACSSC